METEAIAEPMPRKRTKKKRTTAVVVDRPGSVCPKCGSAERTPYHKTRSIDGPITAGGIKCRRIEFRYTKCRDCGQLRSERELFPLDDE